MIRDIIKREKYNIRTLAAEVDMPYTTLYEYVTGKRDYMRMPVSDFVIIADKLNTSPEHLYTEWDNISRSNVANCFYLSNDTEVLYRYHPHKGFFVLYVKYGPRWERYEHKFPPGLPERFMHDYINLTANEIYRKAYMRENHYEDVLDA